MKPHLLKIRGIWHCGVCRPGEPVGIGYTPFEAWADWDYLIHGGTK